MVDENTKSRFIGRLNINDRVMYQGIGADCFIMPVYELVSQIWADRRLDRFVDHGVEHSYRVLWKSLQLASVAAISTPLNTYERTILGMAILLHDIGMQYEKYYPSEGLSQEKIRKQHCELGMNMVQDFLHDNKRSQVFPQLLTPKGPFRTCWDEAASIAFAHADEELWKRLCEGDFEERRRGTAIILRPQLLAALLRFGDELDMGCERVLDFDLLKVVDYLTAEEKAHWCACYYVNNAHIVSPESGGIRIEIIWRVPKSATEVEYSAIQTLVSRFRAVKTEEEFSKVARHLISNQRNIAPIIDCNMRLKPEEEFIDHPPPEVLDYINSSKKTPKATRKRSKTKIRSLEGMDELKRLAINFFEIERPVMFQGHVALRTGWHTNVFLQCRSLVAKRDFAVGLATSLSQAKEFNQACFTDVLAFGTSSIRLGSIIALELGVRLSYTFWDRDSYMPYEQSYNLSPGCRVLVLDDILGVGSVANKILGDVFKRYKPERLDFLVLYRLGDQTGIVPEIVRKANIHYLVHKSEVAYYKEDPNDELCEYCRDQPAQLIREDDILY